MAKKAVVKRTAIKRAAVSESMPQSMAQVEAFAVGRPVVDQRSGVILDAPGYEQLGQVLAEAFHQAARGKGHERHANGESFQDQVMADMAHRFGVGALLGQAFKKSEESQRLDVDRAVAELLGSINYLAGAVIAIRKKAASGNVG